MGFEIKIEQDLNGIRKLEKSVKTLKKRHVRFGWIDGKKYPASHKNAGLPIAQIAHYQEYGLSAQDGGRGITPRPYFRQTISKVEQSYSSNIESLFKQALAGESTLPEMEKISEGIVRDYKESVAKQNFTKLTDYTIKLKGHDYQMLDGGNMMDNFSAKVLRTKVLGEGEKKQEK